MAMGKQSDDSQGDFWIATTALPSTAGHPFYQRLNGVLKKHGFDAFAEAEPLKANYRRRDTRYVQTRKWKDYFGKYPPINLYKVPDNSANGAWDDNIARCWLYDRIRISGEDK